MNEQDRAAGIENVSVWIENGNCEAEMTDRDGNWIECGYHRPEDAAAEEARERSKRERQIRG